MSFRRSLFRCRGSSKRDQLHSQRERRTGWVQVASEVNVLLQCAVLLFCLNLLAGNIGDLNSTLRTAVAVALWFPLWLPRVWAAFWPAPLLRKALALCLLLLALWSLRAGGAEAVFGVFLTVLILPVLGTCSGPDNTAAKPEGPESLRAVPNRAKIDGDIDPCLFALSAVAAVGTFLVGVQSFPQAHAVLERISHLSCATASILAHDAINLGPACSGLPITFSFLLVHGTVALSSPPLRGLFLGKMLLGQIGLLLLYQVLFHSLLAFRSPESAWMTLGVPQLALFLAGFGVVALHLGWGKASFSPVRFRPDSLVPFCVAAVLFCLSFHVGSIDAAATDNKPRVLLYDDGTLNWSTPQYGQYGGVRGAMFGSLETFLDRRDCRAARGVLTNGSLAAADVLVIFNLMHKFKADEKHAIWQFVERGGGLLAVGDHTGTTAIREPFNDLLEPVRIEFNFDSAIPVRNRWQHGLRWFPHAVTTGLSCEGDAQINVGASLTARWPGLPLVLGAHGFSDKGNLLNVTNGCLGDMRYSNDERLGEMVLVATARHGRGRVMVFGDTTTFQNTALPRDGQFVLAVIHWLAARESQSRGLLRWFSLAVLVGAGWRVVRQEGSWPALIVVLFLGLGLGSLVSVSVLRWRTPPSTHQLPAGEALIDLSHLSRCDQDMWQPEGFGGLLQNLMRKQYMPVVADRFVPAAIGRSKLVFVLAPARKYRATEIAVLDGFVRQGGQLFLSVGYEELQGCSALLQHFGLAVRNLPLGRVGPDANTAKAWFMSAWPVVSHAPQAEVLSRSGDYPLMISVPWEKGRVVLVGDSGFFLNRNLEMPFDFNPENIAFLEKVIPPHE